MAEEICVLFHEAVRSEVANLTRGGRTRAVPSRTLDEVDKSARRAFLAAATAAIELGADAREYVVAQFASWRAASAFHGKFLLPSPHHMGSTAARIRYLQHRANAEVRRSRMVTFDEGERSGRKRFFVEERELAGLARVRRIDPTEVLADQPERFSREFLEHKGAWPAVKDIWAERRA